MFSEFSKPPWEFIKDDLDGFVSQKTPEGWNLEYKSSRILSKKTDAINILTKEVSAFNNADGGTILIGVKEAKDGKQTYAAGVEDGVPASEFTVTWLTQIIQSNIDPTIPELRVHAIPVTSSPAELVSFAIYVPRGKRAVQAKDFKYYQRYEDQSVPIRDFQVRDVNNRAEGPDINLALMLPQDGQITRSPGGHRTGGASVHLVARNNSDILAENVVFRIVMPKSLIQGDTHPPFHWKNEGIQPSIVLHYHGGAREDTAIIYHRLYRPPEDAPIYLGRGEVELGTFQMIFRTAYQKLPHLEPVILMATAPMMGLRIWGLKLSTDGSSISLSVLEESRREITLDGKDLRAYFSEL